MHACMQRIAKSPPQQYKTGRVIKAMTVLQHAYAAPEQAPCSCRTQHL